MGLAKIGPEEKGNEVFRSFFKERLEFGYFYLGRRQLNGSR